MSRCALVGALLVAGVLLASGSGCTTTDRQTGAGGADSDAGTVDEGLAADSGSAAASGLGTACESDNDCPSEMFCDEEISATLSVPGAPGGELVRSLFPGGSCSPLPLGPYDPEGGSSCDLEAPADEQGCGVGGKCVIEDTSPELIVSCRVACEPHASRSGCEREGYTCDFQLRACIEGCGSDAECRLLQIDSDADGLVDALGYDRDSQAFCDPDTARCTHDGGAAASGGACVSTDECESDGLCIDADSTLADNTFPDGYCTKLGCDIEGRECNGQGSACVKLRSLAGSSSSLPACMTTCRVGAESKQDQLGVMGHGEGCRPGYRCQYNGGAGAAAGVCVGGVYNGVTENNVGAACEVDDDCYSPFGMGLCLLVDVGGVTGPTGTCSMLDCNAPGLPDQVCGRGNACIGLSGDVTFCVQECESATDCAAGYACADDDADPGTAPICYPACFTDAECRPREACDLTAGGAGQCVALPGTD